MLNVSLPSSPFLDTGPKTVPCSGDDVTVSGNTMYISLGIFGVRVYDITLANNPVQIAMLDPGVGHGVGFTMQTVVAGNYAYVATREGGLAVFDVSTPSTPNEMFQLKAWESTHSVEIEGDYAYTSVDNDVLQVVEPPETDHRMRAQGQVATDRALLGIEGAWTHDLEALGAQLLDPPHCRGWRSCSCPKAGSASNRSTDSCGSGSA